MIKTLKLFTEKSDRDKSHRTVFEMILDLKYLDFKLADSEIFWTFEKAD